MKLFCVEIGVWQRPNLCRILTSLIVPASTAEDAIRYVERRCPDALTHADIECVFEVAQVIVHWPTQTIDIVPKSSEP